MTASMLALTSAATVFVALLLAVAWLLWRGHDVPVDAAFGRVHARLRRPAHAAAPATAGDGRHDMDARSGVKPSKRRKKYEIMGESGG